MSQVLQLAFKAWECRLEAAQTPTEGPGAPRSQSEAGGPGSPRSDLAGLTATGDWGGEGGDRPKKCDPPQALRGHAGLLLLKADGRLGFRATPPPERQRRMQGDALTRARHRPTQDEKPSEKPRP